MVGKVINVIHILHKLYDNFYSYTFHWYSSKIYSAGKTTLIKWFTMTTDKKIFHIHDLVKKVKCYNIILTWKPHWTSPIAVPPKARRGRLSWVKCNTVHGLIYCQGIGMFKVILKSMWMINICWSFFSARVTDYTKAII